MQAILILAHKNAEQVFQLAKKMSIRFEVFIHFDKKMTLTDLQKNKFNKYNIKIYSIYNVKWGSFSIVKATFFLIKEALKNADITYLHLISGQDWPVLSIDKIYEKFERNDKIYLDYEPALYKKKSGEPIILWAKYYYNYDKINRRSFFGKIYHRFLLIVETLLRVDKFKRYKIDEAQIYTGQEWFDMPRDAAQYLILEYESNNSLRKLFSTSFCSDEMLIPTILCNSKFISRIDRNIQRYIIFTKRHGSLPSILDMSDFTNIQTGNYLWARKIESPYSDSLICRVNKEILK